MKKKIIVILTSATAIVAVYVIADKIGLVGKNSDSTTIEANKDTGEVKYDKNTIADNFDEQMVEKEVRYLSESELEKLKASRDPFNTAPDIEKYNAEKQKQYEQTVATIEKRIQQLNEENEKKGDKKVEQDVLNTQIEKEVEQILAGLKKGVTTNIVVENQTNDENIKTMVSKYATKYGVDEKLMLAIIGEKTMADTNFKIKNQDGTYTKGLMQLSEKTAKWISKQLGVSYKNDIEYDAETNIKFGAYYLKYLKTINSSEDYIVTAYYLGPGGAERYHKVNNTYVSGYSSIIKKRK